MVIIQKVIFRHFENILFFLIFLFELIRTKFSIRIFHDFHEKEEGVLSRPGIAD